MDGRARGTEAGNGAIDQQEDEMGLLDKLLGRDRGGPAPTGRPAAGSAPPPSGPVPPAPSGAPDDARAVERYRYLLRTAPPDQVEQAHAEAFARLTPEQRQQVLAQLSGAVPEAERPRADDPQGLARAATRAEMRAPGTLERAFGGGGGPVGRGPGFGGMVGASMLGTIGGLVIGTAVADAFLGDELGDAETGGEEAAAAESGDGFAAEDLGPGAFEGGGPGGDFGGADFGGADFGGDLGGF